MREYLVKVFQDTVNRIENDEYDTNDISCIKERLKDYKSLKDNRKGNVKVANQDCIAAAKNISTSGLTCILNMASYKRPGGGVKNGSMAQEEELARRSTLMYGLPEEWYPLQPDEYIYTQNVTFFKDEKYNIMTPFTSDVITMAAVNLNGLDRPKNYENLMSRKVKNILWKPYESGCRNLVLSAFGCGVFKNDPHYVAKLFKENLDNGFSSLYDNVIFAILNDRNSVGSNFQIFNEILG